MHFMKFLPAFGVGLLCLAATAAPSRPLFNGSTLSGWGFTDGAEFPGATGALALVPGGIKLTGDFTKGGSYVGAMYVGAMPAMPKKFEYMLETATPKAVTIRIVDGNLRTFQSSPFPLPAGVSPLTIDLDTVKWAANWPDKINSDPARKEMFFPLQRIDLCMPKGKDAVDSLIIRGLTVESAPGREQKLGNFQLHGTPGPGETIEISFDAATAAPVMLQITLGGQLVGNAPHIRRIMKPAVGGNRESLRLPRHLGSNRNYRIQFVDPSAETVIAEFPFAVPTELPPPPVLTISGAEVQNNGVKVTLARPAGHPGRLQLRFLFDGKLYAVAQTEVKTGEQTAFIAFDAAFVKAAAGRAGQVQLLAAPGDAAAKTFTFPLALPGKASPLPKPMNCGLYVDRFGAGHPWHMNHRFEYIFDGAPYFPVGGMWCPKFPAFRRDLSDEAAERALADDLKVLKQLLDGGLNDVYFNSGVGILYQIQYFVDLMEKNGIEYGSQYSVGYQIPAGMYIDSFFLRRTEPVRAVYRNGSLELALPKEQKAVGLLLVQPESPDRCFFIPCDDAEGNAERQQIFDLDTGKDLSHRRAFRVAAKLPFPDGTELLVIPQIKAKMTHFNFWDPQLRKQLEDRQRWLSIIEWGPNFRYLIDPIMNETHMLLDTENLRQYTAFINADFAKFLRERYGTPEKLAAAWGARFDSFETAGKQVPMRLGKKLLLLNPESGSCVEVPLETSLMHLDYNEMIRASYARYSDEFAKFLKSMINLPVVDKNVGAYGSPVHTSTVCGGIDGVGFEVYLNQGLPQENNGGATRAAAEAATHTVWKVGTELGHSAAVGNGGVNFFQDEAEMRKLTDGLTSMGVNGLLFFGFELQPQSYWKNHSYNNFPEGMRWARRAGDDYRRHRRAVTPQAYLYPPTPANIGRSGISRYGALYENPPSAFLTSLRVRGDEWAALTEVLPKELDRLFVNCPNPPFSLRYAPEISKRIETAPEFYYLGFRNDLGAIPALDRYFTAEKIRFADNSAAQVLKKLPGIEVLAAENGKPWAIRDGNLVIVSREPVRGSNNLGKSGFRYLDDRWIPERNYFANGDPVVLAALETADLGLISNTVASNQVPARLAADFRLPVTVRNLTTQTERFRLRAEVPAGTRSLEVPGEFELAPGTAKTVVFRFDLTPALQTDQPGQIVIEEQKGKFAPLKLQVSRRRAAGMTVSKYPLSPDAPWVEIAPFNWEGCTLKTPNITAKFRIGYEHRALVIEAEVTDPGHVPSPDLPTLWQYDSIQLAFSTLIDGEIGNNVFAEIGAANTAAGSKLFAYSALTGGATEALQASTLDFKRKNNVSCYTIRLDAGELKLPPLQPGSGLAFSLLVNSNDGTGRSGYLHWGDGIGNSKNPQEFYLLRFE